jgi:hypothetical protein
MSLMSYLFWVTSQRNVAVMIGRFGISFRSQHQVLFFIKPEDGMENISRNFLSLLQYYTASFKQKNYDVGFILAKAFLFPSFCL